MIYSCLENKTDAKYEVLIFEHFHSPRYRGDERERGKRNISHKWRRPFLTTSNSPEYFLMRGRGGVNRRGNVTLSLFICVYHQGQCPEYCLWGRQPKMGSARGLSTGVSQRIWFLRRRLLVRHLLQQSWMYWCVTLSLVEGGHILCQKSVALAPAKLHKPRLIVWSHWLLRLRRK